MLLSYEAAVNNEMTGLIKESVKAPCWKLASKIVQCRIPYFLFKLSLVLPKTIILCISTLFILVVLCVCLHKVSNSALSVNDVEMKLTQPLRWG